MATINRYLVRVLFLAALAAILAMLGFSAMAITGILVGLVATVWFVGIVLSLIVEAAFRAIIGAAVGKQADEPEAQAA